VGPWIGCVYKLELRKEGGEVWPAARLLRLVILGGYIVLDCLWLFYRLSFRTSRLTLVARHGGDGSNCGGYMEILADALASSAYGAVQNYASRRLPLTRTWGRGDPAVARVWLVCGAVHVAHAIGDSWLDVASFHWYFLTLDETAVLFNGRFPVRVAPCLHVPGATGRLGGE
jgi:hypothetical protein